MQCDLQRFYNVRKVRVSRISHGYPMWHSTLSYPRFTGCTRSFPCRASRPRFPAREPPSIDAAPPLTSVHGQQVPGIDLIIHCPQAPHAPHLLVVQHPVRMHSLAACNCRRPVRWHGGQVDVSASLLAERRTDFTVGLRGRSLQHLASASTTSSHQPVIAVLSRIPGAQQSGMGASSARS